MFYNTKLRYFSFQYLTSKTQQCFCHVTILFRPLEIVCQWTMNYKKDCYSLLK